METLAPAEIGRLRWRCRRGMKELDALLRTYLERLAPQAPAVELAAFDALLDAEDTDLWHWFIGRSRPQRADWQDIVDRIRAAHTR
jgi:antitoxin CptB